MPFAYFERLTRRQQAIYLQSDAIGEMPLADPTRLRPLVAELADALESGERRLTESAAQLLTASLARDLGVPPVRVKVLAARPHARLDVFGTGGTDRALADALGARGYGDRVRALGELPHESVLAVLRASDVFLRPTRADGDSMCVREALAMGCRVVASDAAARPPGTVVFRAGDVEGFAAGVERALAEPRRSTRSDDGLATLVSLYRSLTCVL